MNFIFLTYLELGIEGAALATATSIFLYNLIKGILVYHKLKIHPLSIWHLISLVFTVSIVLVLIAVPNFEHPVPNILSKGLAVTVLFALYIRFTPAVPEVRQLLIDRLK